MTDWTARLTELAAEHAIPGASIAVFAEGELHTAVTGVLNVETGVEVTPEALFQIGSVGKLYTATVVAQLADAGRLELDAPVIDVLPELRVADPEVTRRVTARHLLSHTSGIGGDLFSDTGRGDDVLERYVASCADLAQDAPLGATMSYCNAGFVILGRVIERLTGMTWDAAVREQLLEPLGATHTVSLPEEALRFRTAFGHLDTPARTTARWTLPRSCGPAGGLCASAADVVAFARLHLDGGLTADGRRLLSAAAAAAMLTPQVTVPDRWLVGDAWGLGVTLYDWAGRRAYGHNGGTIGQCAILRVLPEAGVIVALLANTRDAFPFLNALLGEIVDATAGVRPTPYPQPVVGTAEEDLVGRYERLGEELTVSRGSDGALHATRRTVGSLREAFGATDDEHYELRPSDAGAGVLIACAPGKTSGFPVVAFTVDGTTYLHKGARALRKVA